MTLGGHVSVMVVFRFTFRHVAIRISNNFCHIRVLFCFAMLLATYKWYKLKSVDFEWYFCGFVQSHFSHYWYWIANRRSSFLLLLYLDRFYFRSVLNRFLCMTTTKFAYLLLGLVNQSIKWRSSEHKNGLIIFITCLEIPCLLQRI